MVGNSRQLLKPPLPPSLFRKSTCGFWWEKAVAQSSRWCWSQGGAVGVKVGAKESHYVPSCIWVAWVLARDVQQRLEHGLVGAASNCEPGNWLCF